MAKPEWGIKRTCQSCETSFYDLKKDPITCPKCLSIYDEKALLKKSSELTYNQDHELADLEEDNFVDDDFFLESPNDLLEPLEDLEEDIEVTKQSISI